MLDPYVRSIEETVSTVASSLLNRARKDEQAAWDMLIDLHAPLIYRWCRRKGLGPEEARDVGQEVFSAVAKNLDGFQRSGGKGTFRGWIRRITENKIKDHWRRTNGAPKALGGDESLELGLVTDDLESEQQTPAEDREVFLRILEHAKAHVSEEHWNVFWKLVVEERDPADVAEEAGIKRANVYMIKSRVLHLLQNFSTESLGETE